MVNLTPRLFLLLAEECRVELDRAVDADLGHQVIGDVLDLICGTTVKGAESHRVGDAGGEIDRAPSLRNLRSESLHRLSRIEHPAKKSGNAFSANALQVVAETDVEQWTLGANGTRCRQDLDQHRCFDVFLERLLDLQLLRPFDVETHRSSVDAWTRDAQGIEDLNGLQLDDSRAGEPTEDDVLRHLRVRAGRRAERSADAMPVEVDGSVKSRIGEDEVPRGQVEDASLAIELRERSVDQPHQRQRQQFRHGSIVCRAWCRRLRRLSLADVTKVTRGWRPVLGDQVLARQTRVVHDRPEKALSDCSS